MDHVNKTLYIPLYGKALVNRKGIILKDPKAEWIWQKEGFPLKGKASSKWLAYYMGMRAAVFDQWIVEKLMEYPNAVVLHLGCGMDSRISRVGNPNVFWYDIDFPEVIVERKRYFEQTANYYMIASDVRNPEWLENITKASVVLVLQEGISMYLNQEELISLFQRLKDNFSECHVLMDCYTEMAAKVSQYKNPINEVGVTNVYGLDHPESMPLAYKKEHSLTPDKLIAQLSRAEKVVFKTLFAGKFANKLYRLYEFSS